MRLTITAFGRPAPQGSHDLGGAGQFLDGSPYLAAWRQAVKRAAYEAYKATGIDPAMLPLFAAGTPVTVERCTFYVGAEQCRGEGTNEPVGTPDIDKLLRGVLDALGGAPRSARVFADDSQVVRVAELGKTRARSDGATGAFIIISDGRD